ncbi:MAG: cyclic nucleotide-binding domain-containing protein, partial [Bdellovibrionales bacterium]|nr:cyclic nucleotide-binding domain-containing protein [Bdellovibrionales bacterium]
IRTVHKGDLVGEIALFLPTAIRTATLQAATPVLALKIHRDHFKDLLRNDLGLALKIEKLMLSRLEADRNRLRS